MPKDLVFRVRNNGVVEIKFFPARVFRIVLKAKVNATFPW